MEMNKKQMILTGASGRMGKAITERISHTTFSIIASIDKANGSSPLLEKVPFDIATLCVDFSSPELLMELLPYLVMHNIPLVSGTTGLTENQMEKLREASKDIPLFYATNMSRGIAVLRRLIQQATSLLPEWDIELTEIHHHNKKDAPSGTAQTLLNDIKTIRSELVQIHGREGLLGARKVDEIGVHSVRMGDVVGEHSLLFAGAGERIEITHKAHSRDLFSEGAFHAAEWLLTKPAGFYSMDEMLSEQEGE